MAAMLMAERESLILETIERRGVVRLSELSERLAVTERTLRRDLERLERSGQLRRIRGGAVSTHRGMGDDPPAEARLEQMVDEKRRIARQAVSMLGRGSRLIIDAGTTALEIARALPKEMDLSVVTNNVIALSELAARDDIEVVVCGGSVRRSTRSVIGPHAVQLFAGVRADVAFIGVTAVTDRLDFTNSNLFEAEVKKAMIQAAARVVVVADRSKFGRSDLARFAGPEDVDEVITDSGVDARWIEALERAGVRARCV